MNKEQRLVYENLSAKNTKLNVNYNKHTYKKNPKETKCKPTLIAMKQTDKQAPRLSNQ